MDLFSYASSLRYADAIRFDRSFRRDTRRTWALVATMLLVVGMLALFLLANYAPDATGIRDVVRGGLLIVLAVRMALFAYEAYWRSSYYDIESLVESGKTGAKAPYVTPNYEMSEILLAAGEHHGDLRGAFFSSVIGKDVALRSGIALPDLEAFLASDGGKASAFVWTPVDLGDVFTVRDCARRLLEKDAALAQFFALHGVRAEDLDGAATWVERRQKRTRQNDRWWGRTWLGALTPVGEDWEYGDAYRLRKWGHSITKDALFGGSNFKFLYGSEEITRLESILARSRDANALVVGEEGAGVMDVLLDFARDIGNGYVDASLKRKELIAIRGSDLLSTLKTKQEFETELVAICADAAKAGNIILVLEDLPTLVLGAKAFSSDPLVLLDPYFGSGRLQVIATADLDRYHEYLETNGIVMHRFEKVVLPEAGDATLVRLMEVAAERAEMEHRAFFTYPALVEVVRSGRQYFADAVMPDKGFDMIAELAAFFGGKDGKEVSIRREQVLDLVRSKTHIPVGAISAEERETLQHLDTLLRAQVIGQDEATTAVANTIRRSRAGVRNPNRPIGSFLFLGPTGVGKTETAKALARVFFGAEGTMSRLDMSEYQAEDGLARLIGDTEGHPGALATLLREHPYGVVLLDEFEKTNPKVLDLFLQVLDEGIFHDAQGKKVNARNAIFIATSNAGAGEIRAAMERGEDLKTVERRIVDAIIASGRIKPELINRFDGVVLFRPLDIGAYGSVARLMLEKFATRLRETQGIEVVVNDVLIQALLARGVDPEFGARPMARAVQELVEQKVAEKIIAGETGPGRSVVFTALDFPDVLMAAVPTPPAHEAPSSLR